MSSVPVYSEGVLNHYQGCRNIHISEGARRLILHGAYVQQYVRHMYDIRPLLSKNEGALGPL
jgi:hypothetical protein